MASNNLVHDTLEILMMVSRISNPKQTTVTFNLSGKLISLESTRFR